MTYSLASRKLRLYFKSRHRCTRCGDPARRKGGRWLGTCGPCGEAAARAVREWQEKNLARGLCANCGREPIGATSSWLGERCLAGLRTRTAALARRRRAA